MALILSVVISIGGFYQFIIAAAKGVADAGVVKAEQVERALKEHIQESKQQSAEVRQDLKSIYQALITRQRQPRMEKPSRAEVTGGGVDGGQ